MKTLMIAVLASSMMAGCASITEGWTDDAGNPVTFVDAVNAFNEGWNESAAANQQLQQTTQSVLNQTATYQAPVVQPVTPQNSATMIFCRDVTGNIIGCRQIN